MDQENRRSKRLRAAGEGHGGYCPYCWIYFPRGRNLVSHWKNFVTRTAKSGGYCSTAARDSRKTDKTDLEKYLELAHRSVYTAMPGGGAPADYREGGDIAASSVLGGDDDAGQCGGIDEEVDGGGSACDSSVGVGPGPAERGDGAFGQGAGPVLESDEADIASAAGDGGVPSSEDDDDVEGNDSGCESFQSWAGQREDVGVEEDTEEEGGGESSSVEGAAREMLGQTAAVGAGDDDGASSPSNARHGDDEAGRGPGHQSAGGSSSGAEHGQLPPLDDRRWMHNIARFVGENLGATVMEGGPTKTKLRQFGKENQDMRPFKNMTELLLFVFGVKHHLSGAAMTELFDILRFVDGKQGDGAGEGRRFDPAHVPNNGQKIISRNREFLPLFEVWMRDAVAKPANKKSAARTTAKVYDIPITQVIDFMLKSRTHMEEVFANPGGSVVGEQEARDIGLAGEHLFPLPTRPVRNARRNNMHGTLVQRMPQHNFDGFLTQAKTKVYVGDVVMCDLRQADSPNRLQKPCRITATLFVDSSRQLLVTVRRFRDAGEVLGVSPDDDSFTQDGLVRVWEEVGKGSEMDLRNVGQVLDLIEVFTMAEFKDGAHRRPWVGAGTRRKGWSFVGEGFVSLRRSGRYVKIRDLFKEGWRRAGSEEENYPDMRSSEVIHNVRNLPYINLPIGFSADDFNAFQMATPVSNK